MSASKRARAYRLISQGYALLAEAEMGGHAETEPSGKAAEETNPPPGLLHTEEEEWLWHMARIFLAMDERGGDVHKEEFYSFADRERYDRRGLGGFSLTNYMMVQCEGDRRILTDLGRERLAEAKRRWPDYFGAGDEAA